MATVGDPLPAAAYAPKTVHKKRPSMGTIGGAAVASAVCPMAVILFSLSEGGRASRAGEPEVGNYSLLILGFVFVAVGIGFLIWHVALGVRMITGDERAQRLSVASSITGAVLYVLCLVCMSGAFRVSGVGWTDAFNVAAPLLYAFYAWSWLSENNAPEA